MFDEQVEAAWRDFHERLVTVIEEWDGDNIFRISLDRTSEDVEGDTPFVELNFVRPQVLVEVASNMTLAREWRMNRRQQAAIRRWGMVCPTRQEPTYGKYYDECRPDEPATVVISVLRDVFGIVHPALLTSLSDELTPPSVEPWQASPVHADGARPTSRAEVNELVDIALRPMLAEIDGTDDGDVYVEYLDTFVWVRSSCSVPRIRICCALDHHAADCDDATRIADRLNGSVHGVKFTVLDDESLLAMIDMLATPFVPEHLREHVHLLFQLIADWDDEILPEARDRQETP
ncbi:hypothetical protein ASG73_04640 [Janibacter sp. Soil728]|uniref:T3SS (YopN, CesT) and YbjN peptide-binding chaperone 1 n=1 Tax=Janibacter sp. Soil728 TaxID=1736393 RepID=UPI0006FE6543|nr:hypothetical protein [Janibacter sp. Soil728]KRE38252.1 hypothetical protein ASG73_04640 [Janibacter sp. Soil728]